MAQDFEYLIKLIFMEPNTKNTGDDKTFLNLDEERLESYAAAEMADRGPKPVVRGKTEADTDAAGLHPVTDLNAEEGDEDYDDEDDDIDDDDIEIDEVDVDIEETTVIEDVDLDEDDIDLDEDDDEDEEDTI